MLNAEEVRTMRVPLFVGNGEIEYGEKEIPVPSPGQVLLQVKANALCGSERGQFYNGTKTTPGHEVAGVVVAVGEKTLTSVGAQGVIFLMDYCGECRSCRLGFTNQCLHKRADYGFNHDGGYGPYMVINENAFFEIDKSIPLTEATMLLDIMGTGGHAIKRAQLVRQDIQSVIIAGAGPIGLGVLAMVKLLLGNHIQVFIMDFVKYRLDLAGKMGGIAVNLGTSTLTEAISAAGLAGADIAIDTTGKTAGRQTALQALNTRGVLVCVGHGEELNLKVSSDMIMYERSVLGSEYFQYNELKDNHKIIIENITYLSQIITHRYKIEQIQKAFEIFLQGDTGKVVIEQ